MLASPWSESIWQRRRETPTLTLPRFRRGGDLHPLLFGAREACRTGEGWGISYEVDNAPV